ncbi:ATP-binding cassette domain-containing protein [Desulfoprunum benzoelyticum]|uniref:Probable ATP-binding protein YbiT n=1 Tax=Desulfoprunum benzoelyticum TaxID=1506996 RepID=A0A840V481_9BACT|nr:ATP-binding cassette domain-containing protein [Desulfoprunum benzoelyticum]MBB5348539.1 ATP-binding cassette subfamily F protein 3 [Desulfoprunum benzoelyticum]MBM9531309.1 ATP-binding cassette domain-containing protein [Desulfoprunum benzoelyticum]
MLSVNHLDVRYGDKYLFKDISVQVHTGNRIGLVGVNGAGKSTLLKTMAGITATDDGVVNRSRHFTVGYLPQESSALLSQKTLYEEAESAFAPLLALQREADQLHEELKTCDPASDEFREMLERQGDIQHRLDGSDIYTVRARIEKVLLGLGFSQQDLTAPASSFSGGWLMRLMLAKMLLEAPSLLLLDEPTNHLDLQSLTWVEEFLRNHRGAMVIISHDRTFLDRTTEMTWELSLGRLTAYKGNYSYFVREKEERRTVEKAAYDNQQAKIRQTMRFVERFRAKSTKAKQVQSRVKQMEKLELIELEDDEQQIRFTFPPAPSSGRDVLQVEGLAKSFGNREVFGGVDLQLQRGDKAAVVGVNGAGKSTFLKILAGLIAPDRGEVRLGANVRRSYFGQHQAQELSPQLSALETMALVGEDLTVTRMRSLLGAFLFRGDEVEKKVAVLSGGEKSRLALARMIATPANLMLLDEPTNHLDMSSQEVLQEAMAQYDGTIVVVSHNRYFVDSFVNRVIEVKDGRITLYEGNVSEYLVKQAELGEEREASIAAAARGEMATVDGDPSSNRRERKKQEALLRQERSRRAGPWLQKVKEAEAQVEKLEAEKDELEAQMADPDLYRDEKAWVATSRAYEECKRRLERWYERWETAQGKVEEIDRDLCE